MAAYIQDKAGKLPARRQQVPKPIAAQLGRG